MKKKIGKLVKLAYINLHDISIYQERGLSDQG